MDDESDIRELYDINLSKLGCTTILACDGDEALAYYQQAMGEKKPIDAVIMDLSVPGGLNGTAMAAKIRLLDKRAKIIISSGYTHAQEMTHYQDYGFQGAIKKNFDRQEIKQVLEQVLAASL